MLVITIVDFLIVKHAVTPVKLLPAPQGRTIIPDLARPFPNILANAFSWYALNFVDGLRSIGRGPFLRSFLKSYSSMRGYLAARAQAFTSWTILRTIMKDTFFSFLVPSCPAIDSIWSSSSSSSSLPAPLDLSSTNSKFCLSSSGAALRMNPNAAI